MAYQFSSEVGYPTRVTAAYTGVFSIGGGNNVALLGILVGSVATAPTVQIWHGTATGAASVIIAGITCAANAFTRVPCLCSAGASFYVSNITTPDLTIYWNPAG